MRWHSLLWRSTKTDFLPTVSATFISHFHQTTILKMLPYICILYGRFLLMSIIIYGMYCRTFPLADNNAPYLGQTLLASHLHHTINCRALKWFRIYPTTKLLISFCFLPNSNNFWFRRFEIFYSYDEQYSKLRNQGF